MILLVSATEHMSTWPGLDTVTQGAAFLGPRRMDGTDVNGNVGTSGDPPNTLTTLRQIRSVFGNDI